jgi:hypothetical protein
MDDPAEEEPPEDPGEDELDGRLHQPALDELSEPGDEEAGERGDDVAGRALAGHGSIDGRGFRIAISTSF